MYLYSTALRFGPVAEAFKMAFFQVKVICIYCPSELVSHEFRGAVNVICFYFPP